MTKPVSISKKPRKQHTLNFVTKPWNSLNASVWPPQPVNSAYESQLYAWRSKQQQQMSSSERESELAAENVRLKWQLAEQAEELAILQKAATTSRSAWNEVCLHRKSSGRVQHQSDVSCTSGCPQRLVCLALASSPDEPAPTVSAHLRCRCP